MKLTRKQAFIIRELLNGGKLVSAADRRGIRGFVLVRDKRVPSGTEEVRESQNPFSIEGMQTKGILEPGLTERMQVFGSEQVVGNLVPTKEAIAAFNEGSK